MRNLKEILEGLFDHDASSDIDINCVLSIANKIGQKINKSGNIHQYKCNNYKSIIDRIVNYLSNLGRKDGWKKIPKQNIDLNKWYIAITRYKTGKIAIKFIEPIQKLSSKANSYCGYCIRYDAELDCVNFYELISIQISAPGVSIKVYEVPTEFQQDFTRFFFDHIK